MPSIGEDFLRDEVEKKLEQFVGPDGAKAEMNKAFQASGIEKKAAYSKEELDKVLEALIGRGGFSEFVGRNAKVRLLFLK
jgi:hypothetical protein